MARRDTRTAIMEAAEGVARRVGLSRVTTKEVAGEARCSEASLYYHFSDRSHLLAEVVASRIADVNTRVAALPVGDGEGLEQRLRAMVETVLDGFLELIALSSPLVADPELLERFRGVLAQRSISPHGIQSVIAQTLAREQQAGHVKRDVDADIVALLIAGGCHQVALEALLLSDGTVPRREIADGIARTLTVVLAE